jgi:surfeit locus 1 family protein
MFERDVKAFTGLCYSVLLVLLSNVMFRGTFSSGFSFTRRWLHSSPPRQSWFRSTKPSVPAVYKAGREPWMKPTMVLLGIMPIFTFTLGTWQLKRLKWKIDLIDELEEKLQLPPLSLPPNIKFSQFSSNRHSLD